MNTRNAVLIALVIAGGTIAMVALVMHPPPAPGFGDKVDPLTDCLRTATGSKVTVDDARNAAVTVRPSGDAGLSTVANQHNATTNEHTAPSEEIAKAIVEQPSGLPGTWTVTPGRRATCPRTEFGCARSELVEHRATSQLRHRRLWRTSRAGAASRTPCG